MEAKHSQPAGGERSGGQEQVLSEQPPGDHPPEQQQAASQPAHSAQGRQQHRQPKRSDLARQFLRLQQQQQQQPSSSGAGSAWQLTDAPGPSGGSFPSSSLTSSSTRGSHVQVLPPHCSQETQEAAPPRRERKPQKPGKYVCTYCGRPCAKPSVLQKHIRSHTGERPYPCVPCGFSFKTKSNLYKHRKSHAHRIKAGLSTGREDYTIGGSEGGTQGEDPEEPTEGESTDSEDETGQHAPSSSQEKVGPQKSSSTELSGVEESQRAEDSQVVKQRLAMRLSERKRVPVASSDDPPSSLGPGSKGSTESGYFSLSGSTELSQVSPPNTNAKSYAEIILGKYGRLGQQQRGPHQQHLQSSSTSSLGQEEKGITFTVPKTQVIEHITKLITINEAVVDTSEIDSVKPRRSSLSRRSSIDPKAEVPGPSSSNSGPMNVGSFTGESFHPKFSNVELMASQASTVPLLRSHSMPSSAGQGDSATTSSRSFRLSHSFDERQAAAAEMRVGHHHRMLKRQPAIEVPLGAEFIPEESVPSASVSTTTIVSDPSRKQRRGPRLYECEACGARCKKREAYETHRRSFCLARQTEEPEKGVESGTHREDRPQMMHYKIKAVAMAVRKRRKEESLEEDPPSPGPAAVSFPLTAPTPVPGREEGFERDTSLSTSSLAEQDRRSTWKEISVIQHTSSFEKQESMSVECQEKEKLVCAPSPIDEHQLPPQTQQQPPSKPHSFSRLVRQHNIQVPEILVTEEPDADMVSASTSVASSSAKEPEKVEEFQWPQRSQTLAQLPAEKLPPKKKRLRLAEAAQSSGESSFESVSLPRSPSQESSISHASSRSASFEESGKPDSEMLPAIPLSRVSQGSHMLTVPSGPHQHHHPHREMRRSASEQAPASAQHPVQIVEARSKSFDYGCLSPQPSTTTWRERRKCLLVKHATLGEPDQEEQIAGTSAKTGTPLVTTSISSHLATPSTESSIAQSSSRLSPDSMGKSVQLVQSSMPGLSQSAFPLHAQTSEAFPHGQLAQLLPTTTGLADVLSAQIIPRAFLQTAPPTLHPSQLHIGDHMGVPIQSFPSLLPMQYPSGAAQALYLPMPSGLTLQVPSEPAYRDSKPSSSSSQIPAPYQHLPHPRPVIAPCLEQLAPVVSLVVPVRLQTHVPTYASAMYTTLSQILVTTRAQEPVCCSAMVLVGKLEERKMPSPYLTIPTTKSYLPMALPLGLELRMGSEEGYGSPGMGGSKRMLSPAGSLELSAEAQRQQKRVKEEEGDEDDEADRERQGGTGEVKDTLVVEAAMQRESKEEAGTKQEEAEMDKNKEAVEHRTEPSKEEKEDESKKSVTRASSPESRKGPVYPNLHTATSVSWCYLNYIKPNPSPQRDARASVYSTWCVSMHNPNLPGLSTRAALALLRSKQKHGLETYTTAAAPQPATGKLVPASTRKPRMSEVRTTPPHTSVEVKEAPQAEKEEEKKGKKEEEAPSTSKRSEPPRIRIFEGGYKSNEEYVYVRGRGRGKYVCEECGIRCKKPSMLKKHIRTHTDVRPYVCKHCNFAFKTKGNLTKHMKSKAHGKKCQEMGVSGSSIDELEAEEGAGGSEERVGGSEDQEEHQFSDVDDSDEDDDNEEEEEGEESSSHDEPPSSCSPDTRLSSSGRSDSGQAPQRDTSEPGLPAAQEREQGSRQQDYPSPRRLWPSGRDASPGSKRALFSRRRWEASPRAFSPSSEGSPLRGPSPGREMSPLRCLSPRLDLSSPSRHLSPSPERGPSPIRPVSPLGSLSPSRYTGPPVLPSPVPALTYQRPMSSSARHPGDTHIPEATESWQEQVGYLSKGPSLTATRLSPSPGEFPGHNLPRTVDHIFSHLPLHSQQLVRTPCLMIPIGGIQMVQPWPSSHPKLLRCPMTTTSPTSPWGRGSGQTPARTEMAQGGSPGPSGPDALGDARVREEEAGTSQSGFCTSRQEVHREGHTPSKTLTPQTGSEELKDAGAKQYGSSRTHSQMGALGAETADAQRAESGPEIRGPSDRVPSQPAPPTQRTRPPLEEGAPGARHRVLVPQSALEGTDEARVQTSAGQSKNSKTGST